MIHLKSSIHELIENFNSNVKGVPIVFDETKTNMRHSGKEGLWLERKLGLTPNCSNAPDFKGYEIKNTIMNSKKPITFGDYSASQYIFSKNNCFIKEYNEKNNFHTDDLSRNDFLKIFGTPKSKKKMEETVRFSWSGKCAPKYYNIWSECGQILLMNENADLCVYYCFDKDTRKDKEHIIPQKIQANPLQNFLVLVWFKSKLEKNINNKFNKNGIVFAERNQNVESLSFERLKLAQPFDYDHFIHNLINQRIYFDSGMYEGNKRQYSMFRCSDTLFWKNLIII
jgi:hypothetical protein